AVAAGILPGHNRGAVRRADRRGVESPLEDRSLVRDAIDVRRLHVGMPAAAEFVVAQVVDQDDDEVGLRHGRLAGQAGQISKRWQALPSAISIRVWNASFGSMGDI